MEEGFTPSFFTVAARTGPPELRWKPRQVSKEEFSFSSQVSSEELGRRLRDTVADSTGSWSRGWEENQSSQHAGTCGKVGFQSLPPLQISLRISSGGDQCQCRSVPLVLVSRKNKQTQTIKATDIGWGEKGKITRETLSLCPKKNPWVL